jgi:uncharacterized protein (DUF1499 family)
MAPWLGILGIVGAGAALAMLAVGQAGALSGRRPADLGVHEGRLKAPSATPNSVSSQAGLYGGDGARYAAIDPLRFDGPPGEAMARLQALVASMPGARVIEARPDYLYAEFTTRWLHFVDDVEFYLAPGAQQLELRSASRLGHGDLGVNRQRIEAIRARFGAR